MVPLSLESRKSLRSGASLVHEIYCVTLSARTRRKPPQPQRRIYVYIRKKGTSFLSQRRRVCVSEMLFTGARALMNIRDYDVIYLSARRTSVSQLGERKNK